MNSTEIAVGQALSQELDIVEAYPKLKRVQVEKLDRYVHIIVEKLLYQMTSTIEESGMDYVQNNDPSSLSVLLLNAGIKVPADQLLRICQIIVQQLQYQVRLVAEVPQWDKAEWLNENMGLYRVPHTPVYYIKMNITL